MVISKSAYWALKALVHMASRGAPFIPQRAPEVAAAVGAPAQGMARILRLLSLQGILISFQGLGGGFMIARGLDDISALDVCRAVLVGPPADLDLLAEADPLPADGVERLLAELNRGVLQTLASTTIADLSDDRSDPITVRP